MIDAQKAYTFDDLMLVPRHSTIRSRKEPDPSVQIGKTKLRIPIFAAPMNTVTEHEMCQAMAKMGGSSVLHRYMTMDEQVSQFRSSVVYLESSTANAVKPFVAIGAAGDWLERAEKLYEAGARQFCIDIANGHSSICVQAVRILRDKFGDDVDIMAGNVCTYDGARELEVAGANVIRVGIGPGAACTTRLVTGFGIPQLTAIDMCAYSILREDTTIVADGGIRSSGDIVKALAMGADAVMVGGLLAGTSQSPGDTRNDDQGNLYKMFSGMASKEGRAEWFDSEATSFVPEGASMRVPFKGDAKRIVENLVGGLKVGMSFANARTLEELRQNALWVEVSDNGRKEGNPNRRMFK